MFSIPRIWKSSFLVFVEGTCTMVIELVAGRILAPYVGVSLYTWTSIIGVVLAGISLGNYLGGKIADRYGSPLVLALMFFAAGLTSITILPSSRCLILACRRKDRHCHSNFRFRICTNRRRIPHTTAPLVWYTIFPSLSV